MYGSVLLMVLSVHSDVVTLDPSQVPLVVSEATTAQFFQVATATALVYYACEF